VPSDGGQCGPWPVCAGEPDGADPRHRLQHPTIAVSLSVRHQAPRRASSAGAPRISRSGERSRLTVGSSSACR
jgi:hypothetical protein